MLLLQVGGRGLESFCAVHVRERGKEDLRPKKAINRTNNAAPRPANEKRLPACVARPSVFLYLICSGSLTISRPLPVN